MAGVGAKWLMRGWLGRACVAADLGVRIPIKLGIATAVLLIALSPQASVAQTMSLPGQFAVSPTGAATYNIPIAVPPGTAGMSPSISLSYSSQGGNGLLGVGWSLDGLLAVGRCPRTWAQDGVPGAVNFDANDRFCFEGQRLVAISGTYGADGSEYRTEVDGYSRILSHGTAGSGPSWFEVRTKSGQVMEFGHTADSQILAVGKPSARSWALNKVSDSKSNYFTVTYVNDTANGQAYPSRIDYTGNTAASLATYNSVQFVYATRPDIVPQFLAGAPATTTMRLTDVKTFTGTTLVADYKLAYQQSGPSNRSRLANVTLCNGGGACLPATNVNWTTVAAGFSGAGSGQWSPSYGVDQGWADNNVTPRMLVDVNGDGLPDVVGFASGVYVGLNTGTSFGGAGSGQWNPSFGSNQGWADNNTYPRMLVDVNGDGLPDVVGFASGVYVALNTGTSFSGAGSGQWSPAFGINQGWGDNNTSPRMLVDVNGDGLPDVVGFAYDGVYVNLNTGTSFSGAGSGQWSASFGPNQGWGDNNTSPRMLVDVNGDGLPDVVGFAYDGVYVALNTGTSFVGAGRWSASFGPNQGWGDNNTSPRVLMDVNGDGLPDVVGFASDGVYVALNTGTSFGGGGSGQWSASFGLNQGWSDYNTLPRMLVDVNGDGLPDVVGFASDGVYVALNTGTSFVGAGKWNGSYDLNDGWSNNTVLPRMLVDVKGTGYPGIVGFTAGIYVSPNNANGPSDVLSSIVNGLGATTTVSYTPATNRSVVTKGTGTAFPTLDLTGPLYVVSRIDTTNGVGGNFSASYAYSGGRIDTRGRSFLGFAQTSVTDLQTNIVQRTTYRQDFPYIGVSTTTTKTFGANTLNQTTNTYQFSNASGVASVSTPSLTSAPYRVSVSQNVAQSADLDTTGVPTVTTSNQYDAFGNATQVAVSTPDGFSKTTVNTYTNDTTHWLLGRLTAATVTSVAP
jgi:Insecticide toxin TcdB middle/N-terminal region/Salmonella virulence plasmid 65kDa B protein/FG-GAP-like repeat